MLGSLQSYVKCGIKVLSVLCVLHCVSRDKILCGNLTLLKVIHLMLITDTTKIPVHMGSLFKEIRHGRLAAYKITFE